MAVRKETFRWQLVANREVSGSPKVTKSSLAYQNYSKEPHDEALCYNQIMNKLISKKQIFTLILIALVLLIGILAFLYFNNNHESNSVNNIDDNGYNIEVKLVDALSSKSIANTGVNISSDNGIRCIVAGCDTNSQNWAGTSNENGLIFVSSKIINNTTTLTATGYGGGRDLGKDSDKTGNNWTLELDSDINTKDFSMRLKLVNSKTNDSLANVSMIITKDKKCVTVECNNYVFKGKTNNLGNIYHPSLPGLDDYLVVVDGYIPKIINPGWVNYRIIMDPYPLID